MFHYMAVDDAGLSGGYGKEIQLGLDPFARLSMYESHRCRILGCLSLVPSRR